MFKCNCPHEVRSGCSEPACPHYAPDWKPMAVAPHDGTYVRLRFRRVMDCPRPDVIGQWQAHDEMPAGGSWFDRDGNYITPGPLLWTPESGKFQ